jgi:Mrp family chromosome partitioning ATPase
MTLAQSKADGAIIVMTSQDIAPLDARKGLICSISLGRP